MLFIQYLTLLTSVATATSFTAWSGNICDSGKGGTVTLNTNGNCISTPARHSWVVSGDNVKGFYYESSGCSGRRTQFFGNANQCYNINTGYNVASMCVVGAGNTGCGL